MNKKKVLLTSIILSGLVLFVSAIILPNTVNAKGTIQREKKIISVQIEEGDSLWNIAKRYYTSEYRDMNHYIREIKKSNGLMSENIHSGNYLIIPCYIEVKK